MKALSKLLLSVVLVLFAVGLAQAAMTTVTIGWDANTEPDLAGYKLYQSNSQNGTYTMVQTLGLVTTTSVPGLIDGVWCWKLTALDTLGQESPFSTAACFQADTIPPAAPKALRITTYVVVP